MMGSKNVTGMVSLACSLAAGVFVGAVTGKAGVVDIKLYGQFGTGQPAIEGNFVEDLTSSTAFPNDPALDSADPPEFFPIEPLESLQWPQEFSQGDNTGDNYGSMVEGYLEAPADGEYQFFIRSDDGSRFELSTDHTPGNAEAVARVPGDACCSAFVEDGTRNSEPISLEKGSQYYFRVLHKEGTGGDWWQVGWSGPGIGEEPVVIDGAFIQRFVTESGMPVITRAPQDVTVDENGDVTIGVAVDALPPVDYQWKRNGSNIDGATSAFLMLEDVSVDADGDELTVEVSNASGSVTSEEAATLTVNPDTVAPTLTGVEPGLVDPNELRLSFSEPVEESSATDTANYSINNDASVESATLQGDGQTVVLMASGIQDSVGGYELTASGVADRSAAANEMSSETVSITLFPAGYQGTVLDDDPDIYYSFDETGGDTTSNLGTLGSEADGDYNGSPMLGEQGPAAPEFTGFESSNKSPRFEEEAFVQVQGSEGMLSDQEAFTMSGWIRPDDLTASRIGLFGQNDTLEFGFIDPETIQMWTPSTGALNVEYPFEYNEWHHIAVIGSGDGVRILLDGEELGTDDPPSGTFGSSSFPVNIGGGGVYDASGNQFTGQIDEVAIWTRALDAERIQAHFQGGASGAATAEPLPGAEIQVNQQPQDKTVSEREQATFTIDAVAMSEGEEVATKIINWLNGAGEVLGRGSKLTTPPAALEDDGTEYFAVVRMPGARVVSDSATLTVEPDTTPAGISEVEGSGSFDTITVIFDEPVTAETAESTENYSIEKVEDGSSLAVNGASLLDDSVSVLLETAEQDEGTEYQISVTGIEDTAATPNVSDTSATFFSWVLGFGGITELVYTEIGGTSLGDFYPEPRGQGEYPPNPRPFGDGPSFSRVLPQAEIPVNAMDNYGAILTGWVVPPETGDYTFYMSSDDNGELYLSTDEDPANAELIASEPQWNGARDWVGTDRRDANNPENISSPITLQEGNRYYIEAAVKEGGGGDNLAFTWQRPGEDPPANGDAPIQGEFLQTFIPPRDTPLVLTQSPTGDLADNSATIRISMLDPTVPGLAIDPESVVMKINGQEVDAQVSKNEETKITEVSFTPSEPFPNFSTQNVVVEFTKGDQAGSVELSFGTGLDVENTFVEGTRFIEAEDYNYESGQWVEGANGGPTGEPYEGGAYEGLQGVNGVDFNDDGGGGGEPAYRFDVASDVPGAATVAFEKPEDLDRGSFEVESNWKVGWTGEGEWLNFTRDFPAEEQTYDVYARISSGGTDPNPTLQRVTGDPTQEDQSVEQLGQFSGAASGDWGTAIFYKMHEIDNPDAPAQVSLSGENTIRLTVGTGNMDWDYLAFVPAEPVGPGPDGTELSISLADGNVEVSWDTGASLQTAPSVTGPWEPSDQSSPATFSVDEDDSLFIRAVE